MTHNFKAKDPYRRVLIAKMLQHFSDYMRAIKTLGDDFWLINKIEFNPDINKKAVIADKRKILKNGKEARHYFLNDNGGDDFCFENTCIEAGLETEDVKELVTTLNSGNIESMYKKIQNKRRW